MRLTTSRETRALLASSLCDQPACFRLARTQSARTVDDTGMCLSHLDTSRVVVSIVLDVSSKNRQSTETAPANEGYETPDWVTRLLQPMVGLPSRPSVLCDPCAGTGEVALALGGSWDLFDINGDALEVARRNLSGRVQLRCCARVDLADLGQRLRTSKSPPYGAVVTNPPFSRAVDVVRFGLDHAHDTFVLQRLNWLAQLRKKQLPRPDVFVIPDRIAFHYLRFDKESKAWVRNRQADSIEYAWFRFGGIAQGGRWELLPETALSVRRASFVDYWARHA